MAKIHRGCLERQVFFRKRASNYRALLQEMTYQEKESHGSLPSSNDNCDAENDARKPVREGGGGKY